MSKVIKKWALIIVIFLLAMFASIPVVEAYTRIPPAPGDYRPGYVRDQYGNFIEVKPGNQFDAIAGPTFHYKGTYGGEYYSILHQQNVWCVQLGKVINYGHYTIGERYTVNDAAVAYIISRGNPTPEDYSYFKGNEGAAQLALWGYLSMDGVWESLQITDPNLLAGNHCGDPRTNKHEEGKEWKSNELAQQILTDAINYKNQTGNTSAPQVEAKIVGDRINVTVTGDFDSFEVWINGEYKGSYYENAMSGITKSYDIRICPI